MINANLAWCALAIKSIAKSLQTSVTIKAHTLLVAIILPFRKCIKMSQQIVVYESDAKFITI